MAGVHEHTLFERGFIKGEHAYQGAVRDVYRKGTGPAIVLLSEIPGMTPETLALGERLCAAGYSVSIPQLFGDPGRPASSTYMLSTFSRVCVSHEFSLLARGEESPVCEWLRSLARAEHRRAGGPGVGVIGMCFTGGFALSMMLEPAVLAPVMSQPSLPAASSDLGLDGEALTRIRDRLSQEGLRVLGLRFSGDPLCPGARFERLRRELGGRFEAIEIDSRPGNPSGVSWRAHSVLTFDYRDEPSHPTYQAMRKVLLHFASSLGAPPEAGVVSS